MRFSAKSDVKAAPLSPRYGCTYDPFSINEGTVFVIVLDEIANPIPENVSVPESIAVFIPTTCPCIFSKGPPELPGFIGASVWIAFGIENPAPGSNRPTPLTIPVVIVSLSPNGLPIAITWSPTSRPDEFPITRGFREDKSGRC